MNFGAYLIYILYEADQFRGLHCRSPIKSISDLKKLYGATVWGLGSYIIWYKLTTATSSVQLYRLKQAAFTELYYRSLSHLKRPPVQIFRFFASLRIEKLLTCMGAHRWRIYPRENSSKMADSFDFYASGRACAQVVVIRLRRL